MKNAIVVLLLLLSINTIKAQENVIWENGNLILEERLTADDIYEYTLYASEAKYSEIYYLLTLSNGTLQEVLDDVNFFEQVSHEKKGVVKFKDSNEVISGDSGSLIVIVTGDIGFSVIQKYELDKIKGEISSLAFHRDLNLIDTPSSVSASLSEESVVQK